MVRMFVAALVLLSVPFSALAKTCRERVVELVIESLVVKPSQGMMTSETKGVHTTQNSFEMAGWDHMLFKSIKPVGQPWTLTYKGAMYLSSDKGKSWKQVHNFDSAAQRASQVLSVTAQANSATNAVCGTEMLEGVAYDVLEADMKNGTAQKFAIHGKYWVHPKTGFVAKAETLMKSKQFESFTTQTWVPAPGLTLPVPK